MGYDQAAAYINFENVYNPNAKPDCFIPNGSEVPLLIERDTPQTDINNTETVYQVHYKLKLWVKKKHCVEFREKIEPDRIEAALHAKLKSEGLLDKDDEMLYGKFLSAGAFSPSLASILFDRQIKQPDGAQVKERTLCIAWQGTQADMRPMDIFT